MSESSAFVGTPPNTARDLLIVRGWYWRFGIVKADPKLGFLMVAKKPEDYTFSSRQPGIIAAMVVVILVIILPTIARLVVRGRSKNARFGLDDWAIITAVLVAIQYPILQLVAAVKGHGGRHVWESTYENYQELAYYLGVSRIFFYVATGLIKISIALFVRRIAERASRSWRILADVFIGTVVLFILTAIIWFFLFCTPYQASWDMAFGGSLDKPVKCGNGSVRDKILSSIHVTQGILLLFAPVIILWKIQMNFGKKMRLFFMWIAGALTVVGGLLQIWTTVLITDDIFFQYSGILVWTSVDLCLGALTANLPVLDSVIMGSFSTMKTKLSSSNNHGLTSNNRTHTINITKTKPANDDSDSIERFINKENGVQMSIIRTDEVRLDYESIREDRSWRQDDLENMRDR